MERKKLKVNNGNSTKKHFTSLNDTFKVNLNKKFIRAMTGMWDKLIFPPNFEA